MEGEGTIDWGGTDPPPESLWKTFRTDFAKLRLRDWLFLIVLAGAIEGLYWWLSSIHLRGWWVHLEGWWVPSIALPGLSLVVTVARWLEGRWSDIRWEKEARVFRR